MNTFQISKGKDGTEKVLIIEGETPTIKGPCVAAPEDIATGYTEATKGTAWRKRPTKGGALRSFTEIIASGLRRYQIVSEETKDGVTTYTPTGETLDGIPGSYLRRFLRQYGQPVASLFTGRRAGDGSVQSLPTEGVKVITSITPATDTEPAKAKVEIAYPAVGIGRILARHGLRIGSSKPSGRRLYCPGATDDAGQDRAKVLSAYLTGDKPDEAKEDAVAYCDAMTKAGDLGSKISPTERDRLNRVSVERNLGAFVKIEGEKDKRQRKQSEVWHWGRAPGTLATDKPAKVEAPTRAKAKAKNTDKPSKAKAKAAS